MNEGQKDSRSLVLSFAAMRRILSIYRHKPIGLKAFQSKNLRLSKLQNIGKYCLFNRNIE